MACPWEPRQVHPLRSLISVPFGGESWPSPAGSASSLAFGDGTFRLRRISRRSSFVASSGSTPSSLRRSLFASRILIERLSGVAHLAVEPHEATVHVLLDRIDGQEPQSGLHRRLAFSMPLLVSQKLVQALDGQGIEPPAFADQPLLEWALVEIKTLQELAPVEREGTGQRHRIPATHRILEFTHVDDDLCGIEAQ